MGAGLPRPLPHTHRKLPCASEGSLHVFPVPKVPCAPLAVHRELHRSVATTNIKLLDGHRVLKERRGPSQSQRVSTRPRKGLLRWVNVSRTIQKVLDGHRILKESRGPLRSQKVYTRPRKDLLRAG